MNIIVKNLATDYTIQGEGETILLLHGWNNDSHSFDSLIPFLSGKIVGLNLPGFGGTEKPKESWKLKDYADFVEEFIKKTEIKPKVVIGHSFGGRVIIKGRGFGAEKIILIASAGVAKNKSLRNRILRVISKVVGPILTVPPLSFFRDKIRTKFYNFIGSDYLNSPMQDIFVNIISEDLTDLCSEMKAQTLLIYGREDRETPVSDGKRLSENIPDSVFEVIDNAGHFVHQEKTGEVVELIRRFIND